MRASSALRGYSKRYGSGDNQRTINVRLVKAPQVIEEDSYLDADTGTHGTAESAWGFLTMLRPLAGSAPVARRRRVGLTAWLRAFWQQRLTRNGFKAATEVGPQLHRARCNVNF